MTNEKNETEFVNPSYPSGDTGKRSESEPYINIIIQLSHKVDSYYYSV